MYIYVIFEVNYIQIRQELCTTRGTDSEKQFRVLHNEPRSRTISLIIIHNNQIGCAQLSIVYRLGLINIHFINVEAWMQSIAL